MSHKNRNGSIQARGEVISVQTKTRVEETVPVVRRASSPTLTYLQNQSRAILGLMGLGALPLENRTLSDQELALRDTLAKLGATFLVPKIRADEALAIARRDHPDSYLDPSQATASINVFGQNVTLIPLYVVDVDQKVVVTYK